MKLGEATPVFKWTENKADDKIYSYSVWGQYLSKLPGEGISKMHIMINGYFLLKLKIWERDVWEKEVAYPVHVVSFS